MQGHLILDELQQEPLSAEFDDEVAAALNDSELVSVQPSIGAGWRLLPTGRVGAVEVGDLLVEVRPKAKVGLDRLLFLLGYARNPGFRPDDVAGAEDAGLFSALAESLARQGERALARGALSGYVHVEDALRTVRGRIRVGDQMARRPGMLLPLEISYDDFTIDIPENRILRAALRRMLQLPRLSAETRGRLAHLDSKLDGVALLPAGTALPHWSESRANVRYLPVLRLAEIILRNMSAEAGVGRQRVVSFVVNMAAVFEDFVTTALEEALAGVPGRVIPQYECCLDEPDGPGSRVKMYVDVVHVIDGKPVAVFDAKYKASSWAGYPNADQYQMLAYCTALNVQRAWLVYADSGPVRVRKVQNTAIEIVEFPLDLSRKPEELLAAVAELAARATALRLVS
ncbi:McrC family protein [Arthrobacter sp. VKM Ac-2550]|uniref:McrC family protein n=1 Tax=Crystallibacter permensis TaxID=1938888 RepID=UPI00222712F3|nr:McrC family protein [Arthrobacter sp. VKM Ac-2550]MCW2135412.1 5-methylcytosine-specific restriction enzyme subunit McrC [Arthrobacter sp. VKM Ac-2550]